MKLDIYKLLSATTGLGDVVSSSIPNNTRLVMENKLERNNLSLENINNETINKLINNILDKNISSTKLSNNITLDEYKKISVDTLQKLVDAKKITKEQMDLAISKLDNDNLKVFKKEIKNISLSFKKNEKEFKKSLKENSSSKIKFISTDDEKGYKVNLVEGEENSKKLKFELERLTNLLKNEKYFKDVLVKEIKFNEDILQKFLIAQIASSVIAAASGFLSMFVPALTILTYAASWTSIGLQLKINNINNRLIQLKERLALYPKLLETAFELPGFTLGITFLGLITSAKNIRLTNLLKIAFDKEWLKINKWKNIPKWTKIGSFIGLGIDVGNIGLTGAELKNSYERVKELNAFEEHLNNSIIELKKKYDSVASVEWVVINETPQTDLYSNGGTDGKNLIFKNLMTNEEKTLDEMLSYDDITLYKWGLIKVQIKKTGEWYIRKLPNNTKSDNLG